MPRIPKDIIDRDGVQYMRCTKCQEYKSLEDDYIIRIDRGTPYRDCNDCKAKKSANWRDNNRHKLVIMRKNKRIIDRDEVRAKWREQARKYYAEHGDRRRAYMKEYSKTPAHYANNKKKWRKGYDIGDDVLFLGNKFRIVGIRPCVGYVIRRFWQAVDLTVPRKKLTPIIRREIDLLCS